jgi:hypothetical protein
LDSDWYKSLNGWITFIFFIGSGLFIANDLKSNESTIKSLFSKNDKVLQAAITPGKSTRNDYKKLVELGGLNKYNHWEGYLIAGVNLAYGDDDIVSLTKINFNQFEPPIPAKIKATLTKICGISNWDSEMPGGNIYYHGKSARYECGYFHNASAREYIAVIELLKTAKR